MPFAEFAMLLSRPSLEATAPNPQNSVESAAGSSLLKRRLQIIDPWSVAGSSKLNVASASLTGWIQPTYNTPVFDSPSALSAIGSDPSLSNRMHRLEERTEQGFEVLSKKLDNLTSLIDQTETGHRVPAYAEQIDLNDGKEATIADLFERVADGIVQPTSNTATSALAALSDADPRTRAEAGRALSIADPVLAISALKDALENESNRFVASVLRGALSAALI